MPGKRYKKKGKQSSGGKLLFDDDEDDGIPSLSLLPVQVPSWEVFMGWAIGRGIRFLANLEAITVNGRRGLFAKQAAPANAVLVAVPSGATVNCATIGQTASFGFPCVSCLELGDTKRLGVTWYWWYMATFLASVAAGGSKEWQPYVKYLPRGGFEAQRRKLATHLSEQLKYYRVFWTKVISSGVSMDQFEQEWLWAMAMVQSRNQPVLPEAVRHYYNLDSVNRAIINGLTPEQLQEIFLPTLIPVLDMVNHDADPNVYLCAPEDAAARKVWNRELGLPENEYYFFMRTNREILPGEELFFDYGDRSAEEFQEIFDFAPKLSDTQVNHEETPEVATAT